MIRYRTHCIALLLLLAAAVSSAQEKPPTFPIVSAADTTELDRSAIPRARSGAASLAYDWLYEVKHPAIDSLDFPPRLITSLRNALLHLERRNDIPALDSARKLDITPRDWYGETGLLSIDTKRHRWVKALMAGKKKTGNKMIDTMIAAYGLRAEQRWGTEGDRMTVIFKTDSLINVSKLGKTLYEMKGMQYIDEIGAADRGWRRVNVKVVDGKWRFIYDFANEIGNEWKRFTWYFDVAPDGEVRQVYPME